MLQGFLVLHVADFCQQLCTSPANMKHDSVRCVGRKRNVAYYATSNFHQDKHGELCFGLVIGTEVSDTAFLGCDFTEPLSISSAAFECSRKAMLSCFM